MKCECGLPMVVDVAKGKLWCITNHGDGVEFDIIIDDNVRARLLWNAHEGEAELELDDAPKPLHSPQPLSLKTYETKACAKVAEDLYSDITREQAILTLKTLIRDLAHDGRNARDLWHAIGMLRGPDTENGLKHETTAHIRGALCQFAGVPTIPNVNVTNPPSHDKLEALNSLPPSVGTPHFREHAMKFYRAAKRLGVF